MNLTKSNTFDVSISDTGKHKHGQCIDMSLQLIPSVHIRLCAKYNRAKKANMHDNGGFARRGTHQYAHDFAPSPGFLFVWHGIEKNNKSAFTFDLLHRTIQKFHRVCVLIFLSRCHNLVL